MKTNTKEIYAKKKFGQNFLKDQNILNKIVNVFDINNQDVIEIGPGRGALTKQLLNKVNHLTAFEIDQDMIDVLNSEIHDNKLTLIHKDFLEADLSDFNNVYLIANIPYYITTDILFKIFDYKDKFQGILIMVQKEVAQRICAKKNTKEYSKLSVTAQYLADCKLEFIVPRNCFSPAPKVDSAIISLVFKPDIDNNEWNKLKDFFKLCFANKRKKLSYSLKEKYPATKVFESITALGYDDNIRIQQLDIDEIITLYKLLEK
ncbi:16S rRNA (adenine(1518)-N(6)/adenine(1519)-N(6))-dimethyltransferase RsmA [Mycoplasmopsis verecunda]|uniref:Ribosomal RNA small subunit methyltransferase A n=1 Tax=Mycoplasmopsis verecunda TaxID=171291 RepID=A0A1T4KYL2_9BACT|nr:16S rRNA (adenine(1518)-N(6)/adenine(1519)-N(6))-dimethyltransferase RsmA [Mycoplasmopsis verecunda]WPB54354.1 16S rRNA (adenine(1518)-N(6)/adenine(1519)-N(6))-dimethyltransferase RsmA [Mycoplasmopsis verecunda]SJZ47516.1 16S rRNA (adenine1518-N6/adenine1519-N6)-dimethyltransferase [Mycoplasmopsis verecunda]